MIDAVTAQAFEVARRAAQRRGRPLLEELNDRGLLLTRVAEHHVIYHELSLLVAAIEDRGAPGLMRSYYGRPDGTPSEMFHAITQFAHSWVDSRQ
jgi:hypothetical protein